MEKIRISGGSLKGRYIYSAEIEGLRPTASKVKEAVFNIIRPNLEGAVFLDLFAGTGAMGIEAVSRGAKQAIFTEKNKKIFEILLKNVELIKDDSTTFYGSAEHYLKRERFAHEKIDIIFADPPYNSTLAEEAVSLICQNSYFMENGILIIEHSKKVIINALPFSIITDYKYGDTIIKICRNGDK